LAGNEREAKNSQCHDPQSDKKFRRHCWQVLQPLGTTSACRMFFRWFGEPARRKIMTRSARIGLAAALLVGGATFAMAQNGPPTGGYPPAQWNPNLYGYYGYHHGYYAYYPRYYAYYPVYPTVAGYWDYYRTSWPGRGNNEESTR
jgi:hypothetical protein